MDRDEHYRAKAEEAQKQADLARSEVDRSAWLRLVYGWLGMIRKRPEDDQEPSK
jgi:hypothetical protein